MKLLRVCSLCLFILTAGAGLVQAAPEIDSMTGPLNYTDQSSNISVSIEFKEVVTGLDDQQDFSITGADFVSLSGSGTSYTLLIAPTGGDIDLDILTGAVQDGSGASNTQAFTYSSVNSGAVIEDDAEPILVSMAADHDYFEFTSWESITFILTFNEPMNGDRLNVYMVDTTAGGINWIRLDDTDNSVILVDVVLIANDNVTESSLVDLSLSTSNLVKDASGNGVANSGVSFSDLNNGAVIGCRCDPLSLSSPQNRTIYDSQSSVTVTIGADDDRTISGLERSEIIISDNATIDSLSPSSTTDTTSYTIVITPTGSGLIELTVSEDAVWDDARRSNEEFYARLTDGSVALTGTFAITATEPVKTGFGVYEVYIGTPAKMAFGRPDGTHQGLNLANLGSVTNADMAFDRTDPVWAILAGTDYSLCTGISSAGYCQKYEITRTAIGAISVNVPADVWMDNKWDMSEALSFSIDDTSAPEVT